MSSRIGGLINFKVNGVQHDAKGNFSYNLGFNKTETELGADRRHGYTEKPQIAYIEGEITDRSDIKLKELFNLRNATVTLELANGKILVGQGGRYAGEGKGQTEKGNLEIRFEFDDLEEI